MRRADDDPWRQAWQLLDGLPDGGLNMAYEAVDRHLRHGRGDVIALRFLSQDQPTALTYAQLAEQTSRLANVLARVGIGPGSTMYVLSPRVPAAYVSMLGALKAGWVVAPIFTAFGPEPIRRRLASGGEGVLVTTPSIYQAKVAPIRTQLANIRLVLLVGPDADQDADQMDEPGVRALEPMLASASPSYRIDAGDPKAPALIHFTSGTTGTPKGAVHVHQAIVAQIATAQQVLDLHPGDTYWCTADPGWVTGTCYGLLAPLACGVTCVIDGAEFDAMRWYRILQEQQVNVWYTAPTALRMLRKAGDRALNGRHFDALRHVASVGEPLNPEVITWGQQAFGLAIHDTWWQTETGAIMIANAPGLPVRPGSMGKPVRGIEIALVRIGADGEREREPDGSPVLVADPGERGEIAIRSPWPSMMQGYLNDPVRSAACFAGSWYLSGDLARMDEDGYLWFLGRGDDVIKSAGHLIGPFEIENVLMEVPGVAEAGVIGVPDPLIGEVVRAYVTLKPGTEPSPELARRIIAHGRQRLGAAIAPRQVDFDSDLPHTQSGKIIRRLLRDRALGNRESDGRPVRTVA